MQYRWMESIIQRLQKTTSPLECHVFNATCFYRLAGNRSWPGDWGFAKKCNRHKIVLTKYPGGINFNRKVEKTHFPKKPKIRTRYLGSRWSIMWINWLTWEALCTVKPTSTKKSTAESPRPTAPLGDLKPTSGNVGAPVLAPSLRYTRL